MLRHVYERKGSFGRGQGPFDDGLRASDEGVDGPVGRLSGVDVKKLNAGDVANGVWNSIDDLQEDFRAETSLGSSMRYVVQVKQGWAQI